MDELIDLLYPDINRELATLKLQRYVMFLGSLHLRLNTEHDWDCHGQAEGSLQRHFYQHQDQHKEHDHQDHLHQRGLRSGGHTLLCPYEGYISN